MADKKISALTSLAQGDVAVSTDVLPIVDTSATETKKVTAAALVGAGLTAGVTNVDINSGSIDGTTIGANSAAAGTFTNLTASGTVSFSGATVSNGGSVTTVDINGGTIDGASIGASSASTGSFTTLTTSLTVTLNGGTANGVLYLNGSKVATSGSALTYNGTTLEVSGFAGNNALRLTRTATDRLDFYQGGGVSYIDSSATSGQLAFATEGSERMRLTSTGLGIGTSSPGQRLAVRSADNTGTTIVGRFESNNGNQAVGIRFNGVRGLGGALSLGTDGAANITFEPNNTERMVLDSSGNLGIGTSSPNARLHVKDATGTAVTLLNLESGYSNPSGNKSILWTDATSALGRISISYAASTGSTMSFGSLYNGGYQTSDLMVLTSSGNLGLGVTPSAWQSGAKALEIGGNGYLAFTGGTAGGYIYNNAYLASGGNTYKATGYASALGIGPSGEFRFFTAPSGTAGNAISFTQAMTLDASGNLGVGTTAPTSISNYKTVTVNGTTGALVDVASNGTVGGRIQCDTTYPGMALFTLTNNPMVFGTNGSERARITAGGYFKASNAGTYISSTGSYHELYKAENNADWAAVVTHAGATAGNQYGIRIDLIGDPNGTGNEFWLCRGNVTTRATMRSNGGLANYQSNNVDLSDARTKNSITPAASMWDKIGALEIVTYKYNDQTHDDVNVGVIAQQVESVEPVWVDADGFGETPEGEEPLKTVYTKDITFAAIKALQEAMARIEKLEAEVSALKGA